MEGQVRMEKQTVIIPQAEIAAESKTPAIKSRKNLFTVRELTMIALLGVMSYLLMLIKFPLPLMPPYMDFDFAAVPELIGTFLIGPIPGIFIILIKLLIKMATLGTSSAFTGELINFMLSSCLIIFAWLIYNIKKNKPFAIAGMIFSTIITAIAACVANVYFIIPLYAKLYGFDMNAVIGMTSAVNSHVNSVSSLVLLGILPFNLIKSGVAVLIVILIYDRLIKILKNRGWR
jgi:riboflavin transporter FmnP